jgi:flagellar motor component MotA
MVGLVGTVFGMRRAFGELSTSGAGDTAALSEGISVALLSTAWGMAVSVVAFIVLIGVIIRFFTLPKVVVSPSTANPSTTSRAS